MGGCLTKEMKMPSGLESVLLDNVLALPGNKINLVQAVDREILMENMQNRKVLIPVEDYKRSSKERVTF